METTQEATAQEAPVDPALCYDALRSRDPRFDGRFFTGVVTTGIYCRPICPARTPKRENVRFFPCAAAAELAGFRPCRRCRPESAPGTPAWSGTSGTVARALRLISEGALDRGGVDELAERLGVGSRHLRRLFDRHLGATPVAVAQQRRVQFARSLIDQTDLTMGDVALASGFSSVKRFNTVIRRTFGRPPSRLRSETGGAPVPGSGTTLRLSYRPPYAWPEMLGYLAARAIPGVEEIRDDEYRRTVRIHGEPARLTVRPVPEANQVTLTLDAPVRRDLIDAVERVRRVFDLEADPRVISEHLGRSRELRSAVRRRPGLRVPGAWDPFEVAVRAILGQQVSVKGATTLAGRLVERWGEPLPDPPDDGPSRLFPVPAVLARARVERIGIPGARARAVRGLAARVADGSLPLAWGECAEDTERRLVAIPGIGEWTAQYVALRALGEPDVFLPGDLGVRRAMADRVGRMPTPREAAARAEEWRPWRAYAVLHLWFRDSSGREKR